MHKAAERLRSHDLLTGALTLQLAFLRGDPWGPEIRFTETDSTFHLVRVLQILWSDRPEPRASLIEVGVTLTRLVERANQTPDLFQGIVADAIAANDDMLHRLDQAIDKLRTRYGRQAVYYGTVQDSWDAAPMRISFTHIPDVALEGD